jgi:hypothetical protein
VPAKIVKKSKKGKKGKKKRKNGNLANYFAEKKGTGEKNLVTVLEVEESKILDLSAIEQEYNLP